MQTQAIVQQIRALGYHVSLFHVNGVAEMHAVKLADPDEQHIARSLDANGDEDSYRTACLLAERWWVDLEEG